MFDILWTKFKCVHVACNINIKGCPKSSARFRPLYTGILQKKQAKSLENTQKSLVRGVPKVLLLFDHYTRGFYKKKHAKNTCFFTVFLPFPKGGSYLKKMARVYFCVFCLYTGILFNFFSKKKRRHFIFGRPRAKKLKKK